jgi:hypothetical protein
VGWVTRLFYKQFLTGSIPVPPITIETEGSESIMRITEIILDKEALEAIPDFTISKYTYVSQDYKNTVYLTEPDLERCVAAQDLIFRKYFIYESCDGYGLMTEEGSDKPTYKIKSEDYLALVNREWPEYN